MCGPSWKLRATARAYQLIPTGLFAALPVGTELQFGRGPAFKHGITVLNAPAPLTPTTAARSALSSPGAQPFTIENGERIAQLVLAKYERIVGPKPKIYPKASGHRRLWHRNPLLNTP